MNVFLRELKANAKALLFWSVAVILFIVLEMSKYTAASTDGMSLNAMMQGMPKSMQALLGSSSYDLSKAGGYYGLCFVFLQLIAAIHAAMLGAGILSKEERDKTAGFLYAKPLSRARIVAAKLLAALVNVAVINLVTFGVSAVDLSFYTHGENLTGDLAKLMVGMLILQLIFLSSGAFLAAFSRNSKGAVSFSASLLLVCYFISVSIDLNSRLDALRFVTPFKYFEAKSLMYGGKFDMVYLAISAALIAVFTLSAFRKYSGKDLTGC